jgi:anti-sigma regulatory factor (Ser/Thr protein kinase)
VVTHDVTQVVHAGLGAPGEARRVVATLALPEGLRDDLRIVVSELVANSVLHAGVVAGDPIEVHLAGDDRRVCVSVRDGGPGFSSKPLATNGRPPTGGRGLAIVAALSEGWAVASGPEGCTVRCAVEGPPASMGDRTQGALGLEQDVAR